MKLPNQSSVYHLTRIREKSMTSSLSYWISGIRRKRPSSDADLRRSVLTTKFRMAKRFIAIIGDDGTGRNTLVRRFGDMSGGPFKRPEIGWCHPRSVSIDLSQRPSFACREIVKLVVFIYNFHELDFKTLHETLSHLKSTAVVYDVTNQKTLRRAIDCMVKISEVLGRKAPLYILIGNKIDRKEREVSPDYGKAKAEWYGAQRYYECSALMNIGMEEVLDAFLFMAYYWRVY